MSKKSLVISYYSPQNWRSNKSKVSEVMTTSFVVTKKMEMPTLCCRRMFNSCNQFIFHDFMPIIITALRFSDGLTVFKTILKAK